MAPPRSVSVKEFDVFTQLNPPIPLTVIDKGEGIAFAVIHGRNMVGAQSEGADAEKLEPGSPRPGDGRPETAGGTESHLGTQSRRLHLALRRQRSEQ